MIHTLTTIMRLSHAYSFNSFIYRLRKLPLIKKLIREDFYKKAWMKHLFTILTILKDIFMIFFGKLFYLGLFVYLPVYYIPGSIDESYMHLLFCMTLSGAIVNNELMTATKEKYYAHVLMHINARRLAISDLLLYIGGQFIGFIPAGLIFGRLCHVPVLYCLCLPIFAAAGKVVWSSCAFYIFNKKGLLLSERNWKFTFSLLGITAAAGYGLPFLHISIPSPAFAAAALFSLAAAPLALRFLWRTSESSYRRLYKKTLTKETVVFNVTENAAATQQKTYLTHLSDEKITSSKKGYAYFNDIFVKRHKKLLTTAAKKQTLILLVILAAAVAATLFNDNMKKSFRFVTESMLPYFVFIMYLINRGTTITQAMFFNCDHSMLTYNFYRKPKTLLEVFKTRLLTMIKINMIPALVIAAGLPLLLALSGGASQPLNYILLPVSILFMAAFFSLHYLVMYYLLQPYDIHMTSKSHTYSIVSMITYVFCYLFIKLQMSTLIFSLCVVGFTVIYTLLALFLIYKYAPKTFRLK